MDLLYQLALDTLKINKQAIIFVSSRVSAEKTAEDISKLTDIQLPELGQKILQAASTPTKQCRKLSHAVTKGIAFHHAGLLQQQKELIETEFRKRTIKIICATPTLAAGLSLPAFRVIIKSLKRYSGTRGLNWIPVLEYMQMAGRAGRPEYEDFGEAIVIVKNEAEKEEIFQRYICGTPEEIYSKLAVEPVLRTYLLSLISSGIITDDKSMGEFFARTFWAHQFKDWQELQAIMDKMLHLLEEWKFINVIGSNNDFVSASELNSNKNSNSDCSSNNDHNKQRLKPTLLGKRVSELYLDPLTAKHLLNCLENHNAKKTAFSLLQMISHTLELRPLLRIKSKEGDYIQEELVKHYDQLLEKEPGADDIEYDEFINSIKTALFFEEWVHEKDEDFLLEKFDIRPGEVRVKIEVADWLLYAAEELARISDCREVISEIVKLRIRVKHGVKEELLPLLKLKGIGRVRARKLYSGGIKDLGCLKSTDLTTLAQLIGKAVADDVKKQVGQEAGKVSPAKRLGQLSILKKY